jgi:hypothetical protein
MTLQLTIGPALRARPPQRKTPSSANRTGQESNSDKTLPIRYGKCKDCRERVYSKPVSPEEAKRRFEEMRRTIMERGAR